MKVALAQTNIVWENKSENKTHAIQYIAQAADLGAQAIFFPEMSLTGFSMNTKVTAEEDNLTVDSFCKIASKYNIVIGIGWVKKGNILAENHYSVINNDGEVISDYCKIHPFSYAGEAEVFQGGNKVSYYKLGEYTWSTLICYDLRFPEVFQIASQKADVIVVPANWPKSRAEHWRTLLKARAIENQCFILGINCVGMIGDIMYNGFTSVYSPDGQCLNELSDEEGIITVELDHTELDIRKHFPVKQDRRWELYSKIYKDIFNE